VIEDVRLADAFEDGFVELHAAGDPATGSFRCAECGYGVAVSTVLPQCPMCAGTTWEPASRRGGAWNVARTDAERDGTGPATSGAPVTGAPRS
jgi:hypothetical protein